MKRMFKFIKLGWEYMRNRINLLLIILWMLFIFFMSSRTGSESSAMSGRLLEWFAFFHVDIHSPVGESLHFIIRKGAHLFEYFVLSLLFYNYFKGFMTGYKRYYLAIIFSFLYACTDEFHQTFVPNRAGAFTDVLIDTTGAVIAILLVLIYRVTIKKWEYSQSTINKS
jgi:VanZ family protein